MLFDPVKQRQFVLCQFGQNLRFIVACAKFCFHILHNIRDTGVALMFVECFKQIEFGIFFDLNTQVVKLFDRCVTSQEVKRTRSERNDLQA